MHDWTEGVSFSALSPGSPSHISAALSRREVPRCRSRQLSEMLILPPTNHCACGGFHFKTVSHFRNQCNSLSAKRAQNSSGSALASARNASSSAIDLICACSANALAGGKTRASCCSHSMLAVTDDIVVLVIPKPLSVTAGLFTIEALD